MHRTQSIYARVRTSLLGLSLVACSSGSSTASPDGTKDGGAAGSTPHEAGGAPGQGAGGNATSGGAPSGATGGGDNAGGGSSGGGAAGNVGTAGGAGAGGGHLGSGGGAACPPECFVANRCVTACGRTPVYVGCCACPTGTVSVSTCPATDSGAP